MIIQCQWRVWLARKYVRRMRAAFYVQRAFKNFKVHVLFCLHSLFESASTILFQGSESFRKCSSWSSFWEIHRILSSSNAGLLHLAMANSAEGARALHWFTEASPQEMACSQCHQEVGLNAVIIFSRRKQTVAWSLGKHSAQGYWLRLISQAHSILGAWTPLERS